jgi:hypothetical protein
VYPQTPALHVALPFEGAEHASPHVPQWDAFAERFTHTPPQLV